MENPIKDNRIVNDKTFARRLKGHLNGIRASCAMGEEEIEYLQRVADKLLKYQIETCPTDERWYHENCDGKINWDYPHHFRVGSSVFFKGERLPMLIMAMSDRFVVCARHLNKKEDFDLLRHRVEMDGYISIHHAYSDLKGEKIYTCLDLESKIKAPHNHIFNAYDFADRQSCDQLVKDLESGEVELSQRNQAELIITDVKKY